MERIALCGGTFDPIHRGHLEAPLSLAVGFGWSRIVYIPASVQPFKRDRSASSPYDRYAMVALATSEEPLATVSPIELERGGLSYTVDTLEALRGEFPDAILDWIIGDDNLELLPQWKSIDRVLELANFVVLRRESAGSPLLPEQMRDRMVEPQQRRLAGGIVIAVNESIEISSTDIRKRAGLGESIEELVHPLVAHYITKRRLYRVEGDLGSN
jgi:nicotinate-nucleotide adenylyltransferase